MNNDLSSYFEDPEFKEALEKYEGMVTVSYTHLRGYGEKPYPRLF